jgi:hypothetical protein
MLLSESLPFVDVSYLKYLKWDLTYKAAIPGVAATAGLF